MKLDTSLLEYIESRDVLLQLHILINDDCETLAEARISFSEILEYPNSKLHKTLSLKGVKGSAKVIQFIALQSFEILHSV